MDNTTSFTPRVIKLHAGDADTTHTRYFRLLCLVKGLAPAEVAGGNQQLQLVDGDFPVTNAVTITDYLEERYPYPPILPTDPKLKALARMTIEQALVAPATQLEAAIPGDRFLLSPTHITAADLAVAAALPASSFARRVLDAARQLSRAPQQCYGS